MNILKILKESGENLYVEDLDYFETELAVGEYKQTYKEECYQMIKKLRHWIEDGNQMANINHEDPKILTGSIVVDVNQLMPKGVCSEFKEMTEEQLFFSDIKNSRGNKGYKFWFKKYIANKQFVDTNFVEKNFHFFDEWELNALVSVKPLEEVFLEKYFGALDKDKIARYQYFSESFFMKHFSQMNYKIVLQNGKNSWRKKENRSKQLDVFLRLKGVKI